ncbi:MAG: [FeFe] hydrogenase H-cluster radical SAM maturase HydG [Candidatus Omnitrophica bacterium]|jgi:2-iminoacetate synthase|nr:[FeFe] hydrogenase H-cluster radical SAM maturase HydG [Candidatus Omnitrophota bacterium]
MPISVNSDIQNWINKRINTKQIEKYLDNGKCFLDVKAIEVALSSNKNFDWKRIDDILQKSLSVNTLSLDETATLLNVSDPDILEKMCQVALKVKKKVYDNRIVTFAPLYLGNFCVNDCLYCGFRTSNKQTLRKRLSLTEIEAETKILCGEIGHKRLITVYGEHPFCDINYMVDSIRAIYSIREKIKNSFAQIRRVNVNAPPLQIEELQKLKEVGIGTYQVFQETYHPQVYSQLHPNGTIKGNYLWRLYTMHRALEAGIDDVGLGALFGLYDWKFEVMGLVAHNRELEQRFGIGAHTISFPRLEPAANTPFTEDSQYKVSDSDFKKLITVIRLAVPHTGMIITCRESAVLKKESLSLGITQTDASTKIGIGAYSKRSNKQEGLSQQFILGDTRSLDEMVREFAKEGYITSFCTAGYRCGRTGKCIMDLLRSGAEGKFCKLNAVLTFREWLDDFASLTTKNIGEKIINKEIEEIKKTLPKIYPSFKNYYELIKKGQRDLYF